MIEEIHIEHAALTRSRKSLWIGVTFIKAAVRRRNQSLQKAIRIYE